MYPCSVQSINCVQLFATPWTSPLWAPLTSSVSQSLLKLMSIEWVMLSNHVILCCPVLLCLRFPQHYGLFAFSESALRIRWLEYWSFSFSISPSNEYSGLISLGLTGSISLQSKGLKSLFQHHSSKASILWHSAFFMVQLSHPYMTTGKTIALTIWAFVSQVMSLLFNTLSGFVLAFSFNQNIFLPSTIFETAMFWIHA